MKRFWAYLLVVLWVLGACVPVDLSTSTPTLPATVTELATLTATFTASPPANNPTPTREVLNDGFRFSFNINGEELDNAQRQFYQSLLIDLRPTTVTIMNNPTWACQLKQLLPGTLVIDRRFSTLEGDEWRSYRGAIGTSARGPDDWVEEHINSSPCVLLVYSVNEPGLGNLTDFLNWEIDVMRLLRERGRIGVMGNFSAGSVQPDSIEAGLFDNWLRALEGNPNFDADDMYLAVHEYTTAILSWGFGRTPRSHLLDSSLMQPANWTRNFAVARFAVPFSAQTDDEVGFGLAEYNRLYGTEFTAEATQLILPPNWHLRRADWFIIRAIEQQIPPPQIILTEAFWDNMSDIDQNSDGLNPIQQLRNRFGIDAYMRDMRGVNTYQNLWRSYYPFWTTAQAIFCQWIYMDYMYPRQYYIGFNHFTISNNRDWNHTTMTVREAAYYEEFFSLLRNYKQTGNRSVCRDYFWNQ